MKLANITDVNKFFEVVDKCEGKVELITEKGDCLDLKPKLCQFVALTEILASENIEQMDLIVEEKKDRQKLYAFMMNEN